jgi:chromosome segregation ATPase
MEQLYRRKARVEIEVEDLQKEKQTLQREKDELKEQIEQLRREKQEMLLSRSGQSVDNAPAGTAETAMTPAAFLEKALADRVGMLLQETAQLEVLKKQLLSETGKTGI